MASPASRALVSSLQIYPNNAPAAAAAAGAAAGVKDDVNSREQDTFNNLRQIFYDLCIQKNEHNTCVTGTGAVPSAPGSVTVVGAREDEKGNSEVVQSIAKLNASVIKGVRALKEIYTTDPLLKESFNDVPLPKTETNVPDWNTWEQTLCEGALNATPQKVYETALLILKLYIEKHPDIDPHNEKLNFARKEVSKMTGISEETEIEDICVIC